MPKIYTFKENGDGMFYGRIEVWSKNQINLFSKVFDSELKRDRWIKDKVHLIRITMQLPKESVQAFAA